MRWNISLMVLSALGWVTLTTGFRPSSQLLDASIEGELPPDEGSDIEIEQPPSLLPYEDEKIDKIGNILTRLLIVPWPNGISPLLYVETNPVPEEEQEVIENNLVSDDYENLTPVPSKRTRYYRKYPWKRQNSRYEPGNRFLCTPSKEDVYRLLVALHEARQGNRNRVVNFCNRKRPAYTIFTNIRFLGK